MSGARIGIFLGFAALAAILALPGNAQATRFTLTAGGGFESVFASGSENQYVAGENDFPVTPAHTTGITALHLDYKISGRAALSLEGRFGLSTTVRLSDPSDGDEVDVPTAKRWSLALGLRYFLAAGRIRPWLAAACGLERLIAKALSATSRLGYAVSFDKPGDLADFLVQAGAGIDVTVSKGWGIRAGVRLIRVFSRPDATDSLVVEAGLSFAF